MSVLCKWLIRGENVYSYHHKDKRPVLTIAPTFDGKRTIPSAVVTRLMRDLLALESGDKLLEIGTGSGSQTATWAETGAEVHSIELEPWIDSTKVTGECVFLHVGDGSEGVAPEAPFSAIVASCGVEQIPRAWQDQLSEGGRMVVPIGPPACQRLTLFRKRQGEMVPERIAAYVRFQMLRNPPKPGKIPYQAKGYPYSASH
jgi:protein-L-isoaspartate(D-aspartate) O-methyltransferase